MQDFHLHLHLRGVTSEDHVFVNHGAQKVLPVIGAYPVSDILTADSASHCPTGRYSLKPSQIVGLKHFVRIIRISSN